MASFTKIKAKNKQGYKYICVADGPPDPITGERKQISRRGDSKKEAEERVNQAIKNLKNSGISEKTLKKKSFEVVANEWLNIYSRRKVKENTIRIREDQIGLLIRYIPKTGIGKITNRDYQNALNSLDDEEYSTNSIKGVHVVAGMIFKFAIINKYLVDNPTMGAVIPEKVETIEDLENNKIDNKYLEREEIAEFLRAVRDHGRYNDLVIFFLLLFSGMRSGELCALKWNDINFETNEIRINKTYYTPRGNKRAYKLTPPKTKGSNRMFEVDDSIIAMLKDHKNAQAEMKKRAMNLGVPYVDENFVIARTSGHPFSQRLVYVRMERIIKKTSIKKNATPHILRHTHVSMLAEAEIDIKTIMKRVGHDHMETTLKIYSHVTEKMKKKAVDKIKMTFGDILQIHQTAENEQKA
ncbi:Tyrosine recombinase XerC [Paenibacillus plantiphilus]|uniref:Tyrosine recombinase XerC n=1 Tax=Paenibacillus plantiphilus TaxID=2905650 RepID=A0ABM9BMG7_9BACL|nr:tyrosine-type recombinase/integrase [Paenibacillus plantiphilus]CAH1190380.1 Tyrosine recombinase XerC [Paenibacillus plantiphilus]